MRKSIFVISLLVFALMALSAVAFAQDGTDEHNFCLNGTWICSDPNDAAREEWNWGIAWYWSLYKAGDITYDQIPEWARLHADSDGDGVSDDADLCPNQGGNVDANGCPISVARLALPASTTCQIEVSSTVQSALAFSSPILDIPLDVVNGLSNPNATNGATPYGFKWFYRDGADWLLVYGPGSVGFLPAWGSVLGWASGLVSNTCPTPTPPTP